MAREVEDPETIAKLKMFPAELVHDVARGIPAPPAATVFTVGADGNIVASDGSKISDAGATPVSKEPAK